MKTTKEQFRFFKSECQKWIKKLGLTGWNVCFTVEPLEGKKAICWLDSTNHLATIVLAEEWDEKLTPCTNQELAKTAKHEAIHVLVGKLDCIACSRWVNKDEEQEACEELVIRLCDLIPN